jgi:anti-sigma regulatory factor (Ser/Thr protein kinase)
METLRQALPGGGNRGHLEKSSVTQVVLPAEDSSVPAARAFATSVLARCGMTAEDARLLVTELASNATRAARDTACRQILVRVSCRPGTVLIEVGDASSALPVLAPRATRRGEHGRGLALVARLATAWGWYRAGVVKIVWAEVPACAADPATTGSAATAAAAGRRAA